MSRLLALVLVVGSGCASYGFNYLHPELPRCAETLRTFEEEVADTGTFEFVSFNIKFGEEPQKAMQTLAKNDLDDADVLVLQEMDLPSTRLIARELGLNYVYYPMAVHPKSGRQFGSAILSPWPIRDDRKILLPRIDSSDDIQKMAVVATVWIQGVRVGVVNVHLQTGLTPVETGSQLQVVAGCAWGDDNVCPQAGAPMLAETPYYIVAGDLNTTGSAHIEVAQTVLGWRGLRRVSGIGSTVKFLFRFGRLDHIFVSEPLEVLGSGHGSGFFATGSDHQPIWAELRFVGRPKARWDGFDSSKPWDTFVGRESICGTRSDARPDRR